jgi:hypothetical protein
MAHNKEMLQLLKKDAGDKVPKEKKHPKCEALSFSIGEIVGNSNL